MEKTTSMGTEDFSAGLIEIAVCRDFHVAGKLRVLGVLVCALEKDVYTSLGLVLGQ